MQEKDLLERFKGKTLDEVLSQAGITLVERTSSALITLEIALQEAGSVDGAVFELAKRHSAGESIRSLERQLGLGSNALGKMFKSLGLPIRTRTEAVRVNWQDPQFRERNAAASRANLEKLKQDSEFRRRSVAATKAMLAEKWNDPEFRKRHSENLAAAWQDPEFRQRKTEEFQARRQDPEFERKRAKAVMANWQDPGFRQRQAQVTRAVLEERWQDLEFRQKMSEDLRVRWDDPEFRARHRASIQKLWSDPEFRERNAAGVRANWQDPEFRQRNAAAVRAAWQNPESRQRRVEVLRAMLEEKRRDPEFNRRSAEAVRQVRLNPANLGRFVLPTIYGDRWDIGFAQSSWEANVARVMQYVGREYLAHENLTLADGSVFQIDFLSLDSKRRWIGYEIMAHPLEGPEGWEKLERAIIEYPYIVIRVIDESFYRRLRRRFAGRINLDNRFAGWEEGDDNLRNNPQKYA